MKTIAVASGNKGKIKEIGEVLSRFPIELVSQKSLNITAADETGLTFVENALLKARHVSQQAHLPALADDSGLEVDCLDGAPGIYSARYAGPKATDKDNNEKLLATLGKQLLSQPTARFHCVMVFLRHPEDPTPVICQGTWEGYIVAEPRGDHGFGYDPIFYLPSLQKTSAELTPDVKNSISHRGQALQQLLTNNRLAAYLS